jgi:hypothetical protein
MATRLPYLQVEAIEVSGNTSIDSEEIVSLIENRIAGDYLKFIPKANTFLLSTFAMGRELKEQFLKIDSVDVSRDGTHIISVEIKERRPFGLWCGREFSENHEEEECYFFDEGGLIFGDAPNFSGNVFIRYYGGIGTSTPVGSNYLSDRFEDLPLFMNSVSGLGIKTIDFWALEDGDYYMYLENGGKIYFNNRQGFGKTLESLKTLLNPNGLDLRLPDLKLDYVDLRFGNKVFYKEK